MKAIVYSGYGGIDQLKLAEVETPVPADNEVLVKVYSASLNDWDLGLLHGDFINRMINGFFNWGSNYIKFYSGLAQKPVNWNDPVFKKTRD